MDYFNKYYRIVEMEITIRNEIEADYRKVEELTREAFWNVHVPGCDEHFLVHTIRKARDFIPELDLVAESNGQIIGNILYAHSKIIQHDGKVFPAVTFGPLSVLPEFQNQGIGKQLIEFSMKKAREMGFPAVLIYGDPEYYSRFGFKAAEEFNIRNSQGLFAAALQVCELVSGALTGVNGRFEEGEAYQIDSALAEEFDRSFPFKEKSVTPGQARFLELVQMTHE